MADRNGHELINTVSWNEHLIYLRGLVGDMWQVLGVNAMYVEFADVWKRRMIEISEDREDGKRFRELMNNADVRHLLNGSTEEHTFMIDLPETATPEDIQFLADVILDVAKTSDFYFMALEGEYQPCQVIFSNEKEPEIIGLDKAEGYSAGAVFKPIVDGWSKPGRMNEGK